jgi:type IV secretory pathway TrbD component
MALRRTSLPRALYRPNLILGGERKLVLTTGLVSLGMIVTALNVPSTIFWFICLALLRAMAKADPMMSGLYLRNIRYRGYYAARSRPSRTQ